MNQIQNERRSKLYRQIGCRPEFRGMAESSIRKFVTSRCEIILGDYLWGRVDLIDTISRVVDRRRALVGPRSRSDGKEENPGPPPPIEDTVEIRVRIEKAPGKSLTIRKVLSALLTLQVEIVDKAS